MYEYIPDNPYILLTPGPLSTSKSVRAAMLRDWCTWDADYNEAIVQNIRRRLIGIATSKVDDYTAVLIQGSGSFAVEATIGSTKGTLLIIANGVYGQRIIRMADVLKIDHIDYVLPEISAPDPVELDQMLQLHRQVSHVVLVHCETTTGMLNPLAEIASVVKQHNKLLIVDAMSSFGGIPMDVDELGIDMLISSSNKCIQGVPGFGYVIARRSALAGCEGQARSLCLDLYDQWKEMEAGGKWRYTSPTHVVRAFYQALDELEAEGGVALRHARYVDNQQLLVDGMAELGFQALLPRQLQSPIITSFLYPETDFNFSDFYQQMKGRGFVLYPGKISQADTFRIGNIGEVYPADIRRLLAIIEETRG